MRRIITFVLVALILIMGTVAFAASLTEEQQEFFDQRRDRIDELVESERITQEQGDEFLTAFQQRLLDGTCDGTGDNCQNGEDCTLGLSEDGECLGFGFGNGERACGRGIDGDGYGGRGNGRCGNRFGNEAQ